MDLRSGHPYWLIKNGILGSFPPLRQNEECDVAILGGGITGALGAYHLTSAGVSTILLDKRDVGTGSTAASTAMLMYATDTDLSELATRIGEKKAARCYQLGVQAIDRLARLVKDLGDDCGFARKKSLYLASNRSSAAAVEREHELRARAGFDVELLDEAAMRKRFPFRAAAGLLASGDGEVDAFRLTHALLRHAAARSARIYDRTTVSRIEERKDSVLLTTENGPTVRCRRIVFATGYESQQYLREKIGTLHSTFALVTEPIAAFPEWPERCLIWETKRPYFYLRSTSDDRIIVGGLDTPFATAHKQEALVRQKTRSLRTRLTKMFPATDFEVGYEWGGTFGGTADGLPFIGQSPEWKNAYFALGYGGNGITFSLIAAQMITDDYMGQPDADAELFRFGR